MDNKPAICNNADSLSHTNVQVNFQLSVFMTFGLTFFKIVLLDVLLKWPELHSLAQVLLPQKFPELPQKLPQNQKSGIPIKTKALVNYLFTRAYINGQYRARTCDPLLVRQNTYQISSLKPHF